MKDLFKNAIANNIGRLVAGLLFTLLVGFFTTVLVEPVMKVVEIPNQISELQHNFDNSMQSFQSSHKQLIKSVHKQSQTDSVIQTELEKLNRSHKSLKREVAIVQTKLGIIKDELPALHQRFSDIENTVKHAQALNEFTASSNANIFSRERFDNWRQNKNKNPRVHSQYYGKIRSRFPRLLYQDSLKRAQSHNIAYQSFNSIQ